MRIGFDVSQTGQSKAGCGYFADSLIRELAKIDRQNEYLLYNTFGDLFWDSHPDRACDINQENFKQVLKHDSFEVAQDFWRNPPANVKEHLGYPDIIHANNFFCPTKKNSSIVYTLYDLSFLEYPEFTTEANRITCFTGLFNASLNADFIIAISEYSRRHFLNMFPHYPADRVRVIYPASRFTNVTMQNRPESFNQLVSGQFWLNVGTLEPRKNQLRLLQAYAKLKQQCYENYLPLVLAGGPGWMMDDFNNHLSDLGLQQDVIWMGYVNDAELQWLYQNCFSLVYPSLFEGFGLPVLEAMSLGVPVITSNVSSIPEIVGSAGVLVDPLEYEEIFQAMLKLSSKEIDRNVLRGKAIEKAKEFSWNKAANATLEIYETLLVKDHL